MTEQVKTCCRCRVAKAISEFAKDRSRRDGLQPRCRQCATAAVMATRKTEHGHKSFLESQRRFQRTAKGRAAKRRSYHRAMATEHGRAVERAAHRRNRATDKGKASQRRYETSAKGRAAKARYAAKKKLAHAELRKARTSVNHAVRDGRLPMATTLLCRCGERAVEYHHHLGYSKEHQLSVVPVCKGCHSAVHNRRVA